MIGFGINHFFGEQRKANRKFSFLAFANASESDGGAAARGAEDRLFLFENRLIESVFEQFSVDFFFSEVEWEEFFEEGFVACVCERSV